MISNPGYARRAFARGNMCQTDTGRCAEQEPYSCRQPYAHRMPNVCQIERKCRIPLMSDNPWKRHSPWNHWILELPKTMLGILSDNVDYVRFILGGFPRTVGIMRERHHPTVPGRSADRTSFVTDCGHPRPFPARIVTRWGTEPSRRGRPGEGRRTIEQPVLLRRSVVRP